MPQLFDARGERTASRSPARPVGPYEAAYDIRRGYTEPAEPATRHIRHDEDELWRGRGRDER